MNLYGCELWLLSNDRIDNLCVSWRKSLRRVWGLPYNTHGCLLPLLSQCLPLADKIRTCSLNFIKVSIGNDSTLVRAVTAYSIQYIWPV